MSLEDRETRTVRVQPSAPGSYLIIAHYKRDWWLKLDANERHQAEVKAEELFPETSDGFPHPNGVVRAYTYYSGIHADIPPDILTKSPTEQEQVVGDAFAVKRDNAPGTNVKDPGVGFVAVIDASKYESFAALLDNNNSPLAKMYITQVIPLNADMTMNDIYTLMTPVNWGTNLARRFDVCISRVKCSELYKNCLGAEMIRPMANLEHLQRALIIPARA